MFYWECSLNLGNTKGQRNKISPLHVHLVVHIIYSYQGMSIADTMLNFIFSVCVYMCM